MSTELVMLSNHLILCCPLLLLPSISPSIRVFSNELALCIRWPKYWGFGFSISLSNEYSGLISFRIDWFDLLAVQGTLQCLLQHHSLKASIVWHSVFFMVQLFVTPWTAACQASLSLTVSWSLPRLMSLESVKPSYHLILCHSLLLLPSIFPNIRVFSEESVLPIRWLKYWSFSFCMSSFIQCSGLISFRIDWLDILAVQGALKILLHTSIQNYQYFSAQLSL